MAAIRDTQPPRLPKFPMGGEGLIESRLSLLTAEDDQDSRRFFDQQASTIDMTAAALLNCEFRNLAIDTIIAERTHVNHVLVDSCRTALLGIRSIGMENSIAITAPSVPFRRTRRRSLAWRFVDAASTISIAEMPYAVTSCSAIAR